MGQQNSAYLWRSGKRRHSCNIPHFTIQVLTNWLALQEFKLALRLRREVSVRLSPFLREETAKRKKWIPLAPKELQQDWTSPKLLFTQTSHQPIPKTLKCWLETDTFWGQTVWFFEGKGASYSPLYPPHMASAWCTVDLKYTSLRQI